MIRTATVSSEAEARALLEASIRAARTLLSLDGFNWHHGERKVDLAEVSRQAEWRDDRGVLLGWLLHGEDETDGSRIAITLNVEEPLGNGCVVSLTFPAGEFSPDRLADSCVTMMNALGAEKALVWTEDGIDVLETCEAPHSQGPDILLRGDRRFRVMNRPDPLLSPA